MGGGTSRHLTGALRCVAMPLANQFFFFHLDFQCYNAQTLCYEESRKAFLPTGSGVHRIEGSMVSILTWIQVMPRVKGREKNKAMPVGTASVQGISFRVDESNLV